MAMWRLFLLGGFRLERPGETITRLRTQKTVSLLAWLALHPHREHGREELIERFWPESELEQGRASLRVALNALRKALEPPPTPADTVLITTRTHIKLRPEALTTDVAALEAALKRRDFSEAQRLYTGPFLPGYYDEWILEEQARLEAALSAISPGPSPRALERSPSSLDRSSLARKRGIPESPSSREVRAEGEEGSRLSGREMAQTALPPTNLPLTLTRFFGREDERERLSTLLNDPTLRVVTLTGLGGTGKTRLAIETGRRLQERFPGGVWFVPLAETRDASRLREGLRDALELPRQGAALDAIQERLETKPTLVILDNLEQLVDDAAVELPVLLAQLSSARFLVTSRARLGLPGEHVFPIATLPLPQPREALVQLASNAALALFCDRARTALPEFGLTARNAEPLALLCRQLEGVPLALELAASWAGQLTPRQMQERFTAALELEGRRIDREARHLSVRAALRGSLALLPAELATLYAQLSVFRGGFTLAAAEAVCTVPATSFTLSRLREHSLLQADLTGDTPRFSMLESVREFAAECLGESTPALRRRHADWLLGIEQQSVTETLAERENSEAALAFLEQESHDDALRLVAQSVRHWFQAGLLDWGILLLERVLAHFPGDPASLSMRLALSGLASLYFYKSKMPQSRHYFERCAAVAQELGDQAALGEAQRNLGTLAVAEGDYATAKTALGGALQSLLPTRAPLVEVLLRTNLGITHYALGEHLEAREHFTAGVAVSAELPEVRWAVNSWHGLGAVATELGEYAEAERCHRQALALSYQAEEPLMLGDSLSLVATCRMDAGDLQGAAQYLAEAADALLPCNAHDMDRRLGDETARLLLLNNQPEQATLFLGFAQFLVEHHHIHLFDSALRTRQKLLQELSQQLSPSLFTQALENGQALSRAAFYQGLLQQLRVWGGVPRPRDAQQPGQRDEQTREE